MLYSIGVFILGVYVGQEFNAVPSIKILGTAFLIYIRNIVNKYSEETDKIIEDENLGFFEKVAKLILW